MEGSGADSWHSFADLAISRGYMSIAITPLGGPENAIQEVLTAKEHLLEQGAHPSNLFVIGAGLGANIGVTYSQGDSDIQGIILVSPGLTLQGISIESIVEGLTERPMLFMAAEGDSYSHSSVLKLKRAAPVYSELKTYLGSARGTDLLDTHPTAVFGILEWIDPILKK
jgi:acetyl esterase/lipase